MPSASKPQAMLMSAIDHGWHPAHPNHKLPSRKVAHEFHEADKAEGKWMHAEGGAIEDTETESPLEQFTGSPFHTGKSMMRGPSGLGYMTHLKTPYIPVEGVTRNVFAKLKGAGQRLGHLQTKVAMPKYRQKYAGGGSAALDPETAAVVKTAVNHLANRDASSAAGALMSSRSAMANPMLGQIAQMLRSGQGLGQAYRALTGLANGQGAPLAPRRGQR